MWHCIVWMNHNLLTPFSFIKLVGGSLFFLFFLLKIYKSLYTSLFLYNRFLEMKLLGPKVGLYLRHWFHIAKISSIGHNPFPLSLSNTVLAPTHLPLALAKLDVEDIRTRLQNSTCWRAVPKHLLRGSTENVPHSLDFFLFLKYIVNVIDHALTLI